MEWSMVKLSVTLEKLGEEDGMEEKMGNEFLNITKNFEGKISLWSRIEEIFIVQLS